MFARKVGVFDENENLIAEYSTVTAAAQALDMGMTAVINRIKGVVKDGEGRVFRYLNDTMVAQPKPKQKKQQKPRKAVENGECNEMEYHMEYGVVCVTPCKFKPDIMVASAGCNSCYMFRGKDREKKIVYCAYKGFRKHSSTIAKNT